VTAPRYLVLADARDRVDAGGTAWRLRALLAMGHDCARIARALATPPHLVRRVVNGNALTVTAGIRAAVIRLLDAWWDKTPPAGTPAQRRAAAQARRSAERNDWPAAAGLDEDDVDMPGYRPWCHYRPATGTGVAADYPLSRPRPRPHSKEIA
jgi:hypothetical protein